MPLVLFGGGGGGTVCLMEDWGLYCCCWFEDGSEAEAGGGGGMGVSVHEYGERRDVRHCFGPCAWARAKGQREMGNGRREEREGTYNESPSECGRPGFGPCAWANENGQRGREGEGERRGYLQ